LEEDVEEWGEVFSEKPSWNLKECTMEPLRDMKITSKEVIVTVDLPYTKEETLQVKPADKNSLDISVKMKRIVHFEDFGITHQKGEFHTFHCRARIPVAVDLDKMQMRFKKGILEVHLPRKREE
jgi:HSP20 family molecular chaperone IbpA